MSINTKKYIETQLQIKTKDSEVVPFIFNKPQQRLYNVIKDLRSKGKPPRIIILKARQMGFSTLTEALIFKNTATNSNVNSGIVAHKEDATKNLFNMSKLFYDRLPIEIKPSIKTSNAYEINFNNKENSGLNSLIKCMTAGGSGIGRSDTYHNLHISEYAFWQGDKKSTLIGLLNSVPNSPHTMVIIESTANGYDDFKERWDKAVQGLNDFYPFFAAWHEMEEYRMDATDLIPSNNNRYGDEIELKARYDLDNEQLAWRRWAIDNNSDGDLNYFKQEYPSSPEEAFISSGDSVFNKEQIIKQIERVKDIKPLHRGYFTYDKEVTKYDETISNIEWVEDSRGYIFIHQEPKSDTKHNVVRLNPYVIGGDTAGTGKDYFTAKVIDNLTKETVATLHKQMMDEDLYAEQLYCLGMHYHKALIGIETNYSTQPTRHLEKLRYPKLYVRERMDTIQHRIVKALGVDTNLKTRPVMIAELVALIREDSGLDGHLDTLREMLTFIKNERGRAEAQEGYHDDLVMALAIAHFISSQQTSTMIEVEEPQENFIKDNFTLNKPGGTVEW